MWVYAEFPEALVLAVPGRRAGGECHLLQRGAVPPAARATRTLPDRLGTGRRFLGLPGLLRLGAADSLRAAGSKLLAALANRSKRDRVFWRFSYPESTPCAVMLLSESRETTFQSWLSGPITDRKSTRLNSSHAN